MTERNRGEESQDSEGVAPDPAPESSIEAKRRAARRRFLLGGAAAASVVFSANRANATITLTSCAEMLEDENGFIPDGFLTQFVPFVRNADAGPGSFLEGVDSCAPLIFT